MIRQPAFKDCCNENTICFSGHRIISHNDYAVIEFKLKQIIQNLYNSGKKYFLCGGAIGFDTIAAEAVIDLKKKYTDIRLIIVVPCRNQNNLWNSEQKKQYDEILNCADDIICLSDEYYPGCMQVRNQYMIDRSSVCVCWLKRMVRSGTYATVKYGISQNIMIVNLAVEVKQ